MWPNTSFAGLSSADAVSICNCSDETTDIASHPEFADRKTEKVIDGQKQVGWFTEDFTLAELKTLRAKERLGQLRPQNAAMDGWFDLVTWAEMIDFAAAESLARGRAIGLVPEIKHSTYFASIGLPMEDRFLASLAARPWQGPNALARVCQGVWHRGGGRMTMGR